MLEAVYYLCAVCVCAAAVAGVVMRCRFRKRGDIVYTTGNFWFVAVSSVLLGGAIIALTASGWASAAWPFAAVAAFALLAWVSWFGGYIVFDENGFTVRRRLFFEKRYAFSDVSGLRTEEKKRHGKVVDTTVYLHIMGKCIVLDPQAANYSRFVDACDARYRAVHGEALPALKR